MSEAERRFPIVGIGASAGGVEALEGFFRPMPADTGMAFVVVTHLSPQRESMLPQLIARWTDMTVRTTEDGAEVEPNTVYVMPSDVILTLVGGRLSVRAHDPGRRERKPIDLFFSTLAVERGEYAAAVVLSGGDGDGTLGAKAIKQHGGVTLAQTSDGTAPQHPEMPDNAISRGLIDFPVPAEEMAGQLIRYARSFDLLDGLSGAEPAPTSADLDAARPELYRILLDQVGHDFSGYKTKTFERRVVRRMHVCQLSTIAAYVERLRAEPQEVNALFRDLLINVTSFFRDAEAFKTLAERVIPELFAGKGANDAVRVWIPGCATGEEVFSIAILMREHMDTLRAEPRVQIFATDIDEHALSVARAARFPEALLEGLSPQRRERFFVADGGAFVVSKDVRALCVFSPHSVIRDPPFSRIDLVSCRNLLIYFGAEVQKDVIPTFHYSLRPNGYLFLGLSENASQYAELFTPIDKRHRIFRAREDGQARFRLPMAISELRSRETPLGRNTRPFPTGLPMRNAVESHVMDKIAPPHVVVDAEGEVVYYSPRTGKYLEAASGAPTRQLAALARRGLRLELRSVMREAAETGERAVRPDIEIEMEEGRVQLVSISAEPLEQRRGEPPLQIVVFADNGPTLTRDEASSRVRSQPSDVVGHLERELRDTRERLQTMVEEYETALEEIKASNEELVSVNEEVQSSNEELEASKEELQSLNEELQTVNGELTGKLDLLDRANADLTNLFESTQIATVFLGRDFTIRTFTPAVAQLFNIIPGDIGRPLTDLTSRIAYPKLYEDIRTVFASTDHMEVRVAHSDGRHHYLVRLTPYRDIDDHIDGVLVTFVDISSLSEAETHQAVLIAELNHRVRNMLTVVIGIVRQTVKAPSSIVEARAALTGRLEAMARAYTLLSGENWTEADLAHIVEAELAPFGIERVAAEGPSCRLSPKAALSVGMILHELATNAAKYGALSLAEGRVAIRWSQQDLPEGGAEVILHWRERGGPPVATPTRTGFGAKLIHSEASHALCGEAKVRFEHTGVEADLRFPLP